MPYRLVLAPLLALLLGGALPATAQTGAQVTAQVTEVVGREVRRHDHARQQRLQLNGAGVRYKAIFKVYAAGLYLTAKASTPEAVIAAGGARRLQIVMLREIDAEELGRLNRWPAEAVSRVQSCVIVG